MNIQESIQKIKSLRPNSIDELLNIFPWQLFDIDFTLSPDSDDNLIIAQNVTIGQSAEVQKLIFAEKITVEADAEIQGTVICRNIVFNENSECNYVIAEELVAKQDVEINVAVIQNKVCLEDGVEIEEIEACHSIEADLNNQAEIKKITQVEQEEWDKIIPERIQLILSTMLEGL